MSFSGTPKSEDQDRVMPEPVKRLDILLPCYYYIFLRTDGSLGKLIYR
jgi:hypothetical protein